VKRLPNGRLLSGLQLALASLLLVGLGIYLQPAALWAALRRLDWGLVLSAALLGLAGVLVQWVKWQRLLCFHRPGTTWGEALQSLLVGFALGLVSPGRLGELGRGVFLGGNRLALVSLAGLDRMSSAGVTLAVGWIVLWIVYPPGGMGVSCALLAGGAAAVFAGRRLRPEWAPGFLRGIGGVFKDTPGRLWLRTMGWSILFNLIFFYQFYLLVRSAGDGSLKIVWGIPLIFSLKAVLPLSFLDLGVREGAAVLVFSRLGLDPAPAFNGALILFIFNVLLPGIAGLGVVYRQAAALTRKKLSWPFCSSSSLERWGS